MRLALVHDYLYVYGGAERTLEEAHRVWPEAPVHTLLYVKEALPPSFREMDVRPTWVDRLPGRLRWQRAYAMLQPLAFGGLRIRDADTLLSFASFGAKAVPAPPRRAPPLLLLYAPPLPLGPGQRDRPRPSAGAYSPG